MSIAMVSRCSACLALAFLLGTSSAAAVEAGPAWSLQAIAVPTSFSSDRNKVCEEHIGAIERCDRYTLVPANVGSRASEGTITVVDTLPAGFVAVGPPEGRNSFMVWECTTQELSGHEIVTCTTTGVVPAISPGAAINIPVAVGSSIHGRPANSVKITGGGSPVSAEVETPTMIEAEAMPFAPLGFALTTVDAFGTSTTRAASHQDALMTSLAFPSMFSIDTNGDPTSPQPVESVKQVVTELPPGVVGDALAAPTCPLVIVAIGARGCPRDSQVGKFDITESGATETEGSIFNVAPERGYAAEFGFFLPSLGRTELLYASLVGSGADTHIRVVSGPQDGLVTDLGLSLTFFGLPNVINEAPLSPIAMFTVPSDCTAAGFTSEIHIDSWQHPGRQLANGEPDLSDRNWKSTTSTLPPVTDCEALHFHPALSVAPEEAHRSADEPAGYDATLQVPQNEDPGGLATPPLKRAVVALPSGVSISPSAANGLIGCQESGSEGIELESSQHGHCPEASSVGEVEVITPLLKEPLKGNVFIAQPTCGGDGQPECTEGAAEAGEVFGLYLEAGNENSGVNIKLRGKVEVGGDGHRNGLAPGQVRTTFAEAPQQPFSELRLNFHGGPRATLANPQTCSMFTSAAELEPWSHIPAPGEAHGTPNVTLEPSFTISGCENRFSPAFTVGTINPQAGAFSPFTLTFSRHDGEQDLSGVTVAMPPGLLGKIADIPECAEAEANAGTCPAASRVGSATAAAGAGSEPLWQSGTVYLTGSYKDASFGLSVVVPANAGPYHLGNIVVRAGIYIDPQTSQITVVSDRLPQSVDGVPLRIKTINVTIDREDFIFNPTNCQSMAVSGTLSSTQDVTANVSSHFQVANCANLPFTPKFTVSTSGKTSKAAGASLKVDLSYPQSGEANIHSVRVELPKALPSRLTTLQKACTEAEFDTNPATCPPASIVGHAKVITPILPVPLEGPAYFVSHGGAKFPELIMVLQGYGVVIDLNGDTFINGKTGITSSTFAQVPDAPVSSFELTLPQAPNSALAANGNLCDQKLIMPTVIAGQNGAQITQSTRIAVEGCFKTLSVVSSYVNKRTLKLTVFAPGPGRLTASGKGVSSGSKSYSGTEAQTFTLNQKEAGKLKTKIKLTFIPIAGKERSKRQIKVVAVRFKK
jgi:hypothetical protein